jgi:hypothetical protein
VSNFVYATYHYNRGKLNGEYITFNNYNKPSEIKIFDNDKFKKVIYFDSLGTNHSRMYEVLDETSGSYKCLKTDYYDNEIVSQMYWIEKTEPINYHWFELLFFIAIQPRTSGEVKGYKAGSYVVKNQNDQPLVKGEYYKDKRLGNWTQYDYQQGVKLETKYIDGKVSS